ncbi:MAG: DNA-3-methyladenine glycosylase I [Chloroflexota bacterium]|nr:DNA-3-methyladenine glycosylase I [Chloroflexota bacterium]
MIDDLVRCTWVTPDPLYTRYHDEEWGVPIAPDAPDADARFFERLCLEGAQAGLSWLTILRKRDHYRRAFDGFDPAIVARYDETKFAALMADAGIVRNRAKIAAAIGNARAVLDLQAEGFGLAGYLWGFVGARRVNAWASHADVPSETDESRAMSKALKARGFKFVGATICYALMQATGMVDDHTVACFRHDAGV